MPHAGCPENKEHEGAGPGGGALTIQDYRKFQGNKDIQYDDAIKDDMKKFIFCLAAAAANAPGQRSDRDVKAGIDGTCMYALAAPFFSRVDGRNPLMRKRGSRSKQSIPSSETRSWPTGKHSLTRCGTLP